MKVIVKVEHIKFFYKTKVITDFWIVYRLSPLFPLPMMCDVCKVVALSLVVGKGAGKARTLSRPFKSSPSDCKIVAKTSIGLFETKLSSARALQVLWYGAVSLWSTRLDFTAHKPRSCAGQRCGNSLPLIRPVQLKHT